MRRTVHLSLVLVALALAPFLVGADPPPASVPPASPPAPAPILREMAVTFDDLPVATRLRGDVARQERITADLLAAIRRHRVPAVGFVNEDKLRHDGALDPRRVALLERWLEAGLELGNHTYSHPDLHRTPLADFETEVLRGEEVTRRLLAARGLRPRWFRHPFLHTGRDLATRRAFEAFLAEHGYRVAPVTIDNYDYMYAAAYERAGERGGTEAAEAAEAQRRIAAEYLDYMLRVVAYYEQQSAALFGRNVRHVLLLHANALNAAAFDALAARLAERGYAFVTLERALADEAYASKDEYTGPAGITWLHRWAITRGEKPALFAGEPEVPAHIREALGGR